MARVASALRQLKAHFDRRTCSDIISRNYLYRRPRSLLLEPRTTTSRNNAWLGRLLLFLMVTAYAYHGVLPWIFKKSPLSPTQLFSKVFRSSSNEHTEKFSRKS